VTPAAVPLGVRLAERRTRLLVGLATAAGTLLRAGRGPVRALPGLAAAAAVSVGLGELAGHVFGRGLAPWVALTAGGVFALRLAAELNHVPPPPARDDSDGGGL